MRLFETYWPDQTERSVLGRFYLSEGIGEVLNVIMPFRFVYLYLVMHRPEWAPLVMFAETATVLVLDVPTGVIADRWGRKLSVVTGLALYASSLFFVPAAVAAQGERQLLGVGAAFVVGAIGQTLISGADQAWAIDNLHSVGHGDLIERYFARIHSFASMGGVGAGLLALMILLSTNITRQVLDLLWYLAGIGFLLSTAICLTIPENRPPGGTTAVTRKGAFVREFLHGLRALSLRRTLAMLSLAVVLASLSGSIADEAFDLSMITNGLDARALAPLSIGTELIGIFAPVIGMQLARDFGMTRVLVFFLSLPATLVCIYFFQPPLWAIVGLYLVLAFCDGAWDPVAEAGVQRELTSDLRATAGSALNQACGLVELAGLGLFTALLGEHSAALSEATPDLLAAFSGGNRTLPRVPTGLFGLPIPALIIILFVMFGLLAIPFLLAAKTKPGGTGAHETTSARSA